MRKNSNPNFIEPVAINERGVSLLEALIAVTLTLIVLVGLYQVLDENTKIFKAQQQLTIMNTQVRTAMELITRTIRGAGSNRRGLQGAAMIYYADADKIRVLADLAQDHHAGSSGTTPDSDTFDYRDLSADGFFDDDNENENGDEQLNDMDEDVTYFLNGETLIKRYFSDTDPFDIEIGGTNGSDTIPGIAIPVDQPGEDDETIAENIIDLSFRYFVDSRGVTDSAFELTGSPLSLASRNSIGLIRVTIVGKTKDRNRVSGKYHTTELSSSIELRNR